MAPYQSLKAWQHAQRLAIECARAAKAFPEYEQDALADQLRRACYTVVLNIAEEARSEALASTGSTLTPQTDHSQRSRRRWASLASWNTYRLPSSEDWRHWLPRPARRFSACFERSLITHGVNLVPLAPELR